MTFSILQRSVVAATVAVLSVSGTASAQPEAPGAASSSAAARSSAKLGPRLLTPEEKRDTAGIGSDLVPERQVVTSQVSIPFGKAPAPPSTDKQAARRGLPVSATGRIDDAAASCEAQVNTASRTACLQRQNKK